MLPVKPIRPNIRAYTGYIEEWNYKMNRAIFLDRDGTIIEDAGYLSDPQNIRPLPGVKKVLESLRDQGYLIILITNQSGIGRGFFTRNQYMLLHAFLVKEFQDEDSLSLIDDTYICPHKPEDKCVCRKPSPYLILQAAKDYDIDLSQSYMFGDKESDVKAGERAGCKESHLITNQQNLEYYYNEIFQ